MGVEPKRVRTDWWAGDGPSVKPVRAVRLLHPLKAGHRAPVIRRDFEIVEGTEWRRL